MTLISLHPYIGTFEISIYGFIKLRNIVRLKGKACIHGDSGALKNNSGPKQDPCGAPTSKNLVWRIVMCVRLGAKNNI